MSNAIDRMTERMLDDAGIGPGMRVLDIGCGPGAVSLMVARRVGDGGHVVAVDRDPAMVEAARAQAHGLGLSNITVVEGGFDVALPGHGTFDAAVGRRVLMYQLDPVEAVTLLARALRPGGVVAFHEHDLMAASEDHPSLPLHNRVRSWLRELLRREGANLRMGADLRRVLEAAGLGVTCVRAEANVLTPSTDYPIPAIVRAVTPRLLHHGVTTEAEIAIDSLDERLRAERWEAGTPYVWETVFCGWAKKP